MAELQAEISQLESENVGPKDWVLMGEADSRKRPQNSLLEEDLEFERTMKSVPVVTEQAVQNLEERIKARILEGRFDDVVRIKAVQDKPFLPSKYFELKDTKSTQSLAQIYEDDYVAAQTDGVAGEDRDGKLKKEHEEIEKIWEKLSNKLDALCNTHYTPKQVSFIPINNVQYGMLLTHHVTAKSYYINNLERVHSNTRERASDDTVSIYTTSPGRSVRPSCWSTASSQRDDARTEEGFAQ
jgi:U3 small nucleolar RNA-associated protein MPP10